MGKIDKPRQSEMRSLMLKFDGNISNIARYKGVSITTVNNWINSLEMRDELSEIRGYENSQRGTNATKQTDTDRYREAIERLINTRKGQGLTQRTVEKEIGLNRSHLSHYEKGSVTLPFNVFWDLCQFYGIDPRWVMTGEIVEDEPNTKNNNDVSPAGQEWLDALAYMEYSIRLMKNGTLNGVAMAGLEATLEHLIQLLNSNDKEI